jgi:hypothetical protein
VRLSRLLTGTVAAALIGAGAMLGAALPASAVTADGTLSLTTTRAVVGDQTTFHFSTDAGGAGDPSDLGYLALAEVHSPAYPAHEISRWEAPLLG